MDVLKNSEKIRTINLHKLYGNLCNFEETKILHKEIMKDSFKDKSYARFTKKSSFTPNSDKSDNAYSEEEYNVDLVSSAAIMVKHYYDKNFGGLRKFQTKVNSSATTRADTRSFEKPTVEKKDEGTCFNCGGN